MKICPVCQAVAFDDAEICYGCLHRFDGAEQLVAVVVDEQVTAAGSHDDHGDFAKERDNVNGPSRFEEDQVVLECTIEEGSATETENEASEDVCVGECESKPEEATRRMNPPGFVIRFIPTQEPTGVVSWACSIEQVG